MPYKKPFPKSAKIKKPPLPAPIGPRRRPGLRSGRQPRYRLVKTKQQNIDRAIQEEYKPRRRSKVHRGSDFQALPFRRVPVRRLNGWPFSHGGKFLNMRLAFTTSCFENVEIFLMRGSARDAPDVEPRKGNQKP
jgi:hypothetical protein